MKDIKKRKKKRKTCFLYRSTLKKKQCFSITVQERERDREREREDERPRLEQKETFQQI
jgi:hypothetical protein